MTLREALALAGMLTIILFGESIAEAIVRLLP